MIDNPIPLHVYEREQTSGATVPRCLPEIEASSLADKPVPPRKWLVEDLIPAKTVTLLSGDGGVGKSILALQLVVASVSGGYWVGRPVEPGTCVFISAEDDADELHRRLVDIAAAADVPLGDLVGLTLSSLAGDDAILAAPEGGRNVLKTTPLFAALDSLVDRRRPSLVVLDTLADFFGGEENQRAQARQFIGLLRGLCSRHGCTVLLLAHPSLSGMATGSGSSGSTAWNNSVRSRLYFERVKDKEEGEADPDARVLKTMKSNYGPIGQQIPLRWQAGAFRTPASPDTFTVIAAHAQAERTLLDLLAIYEDEGRYVSATPSANYLPTIFSRDSRVGGVTKRALTEAMNRLFEAKKIGFVSYGPPSKDRKRIAIVQPEHPA